MVMAIRVASALSSSLRASRASGNMAWRRFAGVQHALFSTKYTKQHEYISVNGNVGTIGITDFAQNQLGDVVFVDLPSVGDSFAKGDAFGAVESVKAASDVYVPASGKVVEINENLNENPNLVNEEAMTGGWFVKIELENPSELDELLDEAAYKEHCENEEH
ncbi:hypothetical protein P43SY_000359 [Pythium insidiosum]|uniref:Glycine cleavage system H protein n=1 Tax=Pythium insidiosum TaxID=114742 RepID=A0AAD5LMG1_PYTIN|nr:hypothetical protein P43SY_000359 [Pythium insidiosum]